MLYSYGDGSFSFDSFGNLYVFEPLLMWGNTLDPLFLFLEFIKLEESEIFVLGIYYPGPGTFLLLVISIKSWNLVLC